MLKDIKIDTRNGEEVLIATKEETVSNKIVVSRGAIEQEISTITERLEELQSMLGAF